MQLRVLRGSFLSKHKKNETILKKQVGSEISGALQYLPEERLSSMDFSLCSSQINQTEVYATKYLNEPVA